MSEKCCGNCKHFKNEGIYGFGFCVVFECVHHCTGGGRCVAHQFNDNGWTEITPDNVDELYPIKEELLMIAFKLCDKIYYQCKSLMLSKLEEMADSDGYYYYVLPELKIE